MPTDDDRARALVAVRAGASDEDAAAYGGLDVQDLREGEFGREIAQAKNDLAIFASGVIRQAMAGSPAIAQRYLNRIEGERELERLRSIAEG